MFFEIVRQIKTAFILLIFFTLLTGLIYPFVITGFAQALFPWRANGSLIQHDHKIIGSQLIGQLFSDPKYFWSRPSATLLFPYNTKYSSGSNFGPSNPNFLNIVKNRAAFLRSVDPENKNLIPVDLVTASGSGLDPEISLLAAFYQQHRIALARNISEKKIETLILKMMKKRIFGILGEPRVNVLELNIALDNLVSQNT